jgi:copper oxidase (laccase) domain-containing protein
MRYTEHSGLILIEGFFPENIICGFSTNSFAGLVPEDIRTISSLIGVGGFAYMKQVHRADILEVSGPCVSIADGIMTAKPGLLLAVKTADCMPIMLSDAKELGVIHMGWRSAESGILNNISRGLSGYKAAAGVGLRKCCYKVGEDFRRIKAFEGYLSEKDGLYFDPIGFIRDSLMAAGLEEHNFLDTGICSVCQGERFFSYRRGAAHDRTLSFILKQS